MQTPQNSVHPLPPGKMRWQTGPADPIRCLDSFGKSPQEVVKRLLGDSDTLERRSRLVCVVCSHSITSTAAVTERQGSHQHHLTNPHGLSFLLGCFSDAPGCTETGQPVAADNWFARHVWRIALCGRCHTHLGWVFYGPDSNRFFGLILNRIKPQP
ncbi:MAG: cereblon family protein [Gammaproteobacteria bacterium]|nr:cereblon family protein [Gammaproteobacteria bacterium]